MRVEGQGHGRAGDRPGLPLQGGQEGGVPPVDAVKVADGHRPGPARHRGHLVPGEMVYGHDSASQGSGAIVVILPSGNETARPRSDMREPFAS